MRIVKAGLVDPIPLGKRGEQNAVQVEFDLSGFIRDFGEGVAGLTVRRPGDSREYAACLERRGDTAVWTVGGEWTATDGQGKCELSWFVGEDTIAKDMRSWRTVVAESMGAGEGTPTAPEMAYLAKIQQAGARVEQAAREAEGYTINPPTVRDGSWWLWDGEKYVDSGVGAATQGPAGVGVASIEYDTEHWCWVLRYTDGRVLTFPGASPVDGGRFTYLRDDFEDCPVGEDTFYGNERYLFEERYHVDGAGVRFATYDVVEDGNGKLLKLTCTNHVKNAKLYNKIYMAAPVVGGCTMEVEFMMEQPEYDKGRPGIHLDLFGKHWFGGVEDDNRIIRMAVRAKGYVRITDTATTVAAINTVLTDHDGKRFVPECGVWYVVRHSCERGRVSLAIWERDTSSFEQAYTLEYQTDTISDEVMRATRFVSLQTCNGEADGVVGIPYTAYVAQMRVWHDLTGPAGKDGSDGADGADGVGVADWRYNPDTWRWEMHYTDGRVDTFPGMSLTERGKFTVHRDNFEGYPVGVDTFYNNDRYKFSAANHGDPNSDSYAVYGVAKDGDGQVLELVCENATTHYLRTVHTVSGPYAMSMDFKLDTTVPGSRPGFVLRPVANSALANQVSVMLRAGGYARIRDTSSGATQDTNILSDEDKNWKPVEGVWYHVEVQCKLGQLTMRIWEKENPATTVRSVTAEVAALDEVILNYPKTQSLQTYAPGSASQPVVGGRHTMLVDELRVWQDVVPGMTEADKAEIVSRVLAEMK